MNVPIPNQCAHMPTVSDTNTQRTTKRRLILAQTLEISFGPRELHFVRKCRAGLDNAGRSFFFGRQAETIIPIGMTLVGGLLRRPFSQMVTRRMYAGRGFAVLGWLAQVYGTTTSTFKPMGTQMTPLRPPAVVVDRLLVWYQRSAVERGGIWGCPHPALRHLHVQTSRFAVCKTQRLF